MSEAAALGIPLVPKRAADAEILVNSAGAGTAVSFPATPWAPERSLLALTLRPEFVAQAVMGALHRRRPPVRYVPSWRYRVLERCCATHPCAP